MKANALDSVGGRLKWLRKELRVSAREVDRLAGLHSGHTWVIEKSAECRAQVNTLESIARALHIEPAWLVFGAGSKPDAAKSRVAMGLPANGVPAKAVA